MQQQQQQPWGGFSSEKKFLKDIVAILITNFSSFEK